MSGNTFVYRILDEERDETRGVVDYRNLRDALLKRIETMEESWEVCVAHMEQITETIGSVIADGATSGEFDATDVPLAAMCACTAMMRFFHPQMIAQCAEKPGPSLDQMIDFVIAGLAPHGNAAKH